MKKFRLLTLATLVATMLSTSCDKTEDPAPEPNPNPNPNPVELVDQYEWNSKVTGIKSVVANIIPNEIVETVYICLSPEAGITSCEELIGSDKEYLMIEIDTDIAEYPEIYTETETGFMIDMKEAHSAVYVWYMKNGEPVASFDDNSILDDGYILCTENPADEDLATVDMVLDFAGGNDLLRANFQIRESDITIPTPDYPENYIAEDVSFFEEIQSAFAFETGGYTFVVMSQTAGYTSWEECMDGGDYIMMSIANEAVGQTIDMTTYENYSFVNYSPLAQSIETISPLEPETLAILSQGEMCIEKNGEYTDARFSIETTDDTLFEGKVHVYTPAPENYITFNDGTKPIRAAFYYENYLYLTPGGIDYGQDISDCSQYLCLTKPVTGETVDVATSADDFMVIFAYDYGEGQIVSMKGSGDSGSYTVKTLGENEYEITFDITFADGNHIEGQYSGSFKDFLAEPQKENEYTFEGVPHAINSVVVDTTSSVYTFYFSSEAGLVTVDDMNTAGDLVTVKADATICNGNSWGFSSAAAEGKELSVIYNGVTYNSAAGSFGTLNAVLSESELQLSFAGYGEAPDIYYKGSVAVVK